MRIKESRARTFVPGLSVALALASIPAGAQEGTAAPPAAPQAEPAPTPPLAHNYGEALAAELFTTGRDLMAAGQYAEACPKLAESARIDQRVGTLGKLAECEERLGQLVRARTHWQQAQNLARAQGDDRLAEAAAQFQRVDAIVPKVRLVPQGSLPADLKIWIDDLELGASSVGVPIPLDPGQHKLAASAAGKRRWSALVHLRAGGGVTPLELPPLAGAPAAPPPAPPAAAPPEDGVPALRVAGLVMAGLGAAGVVAGGYFGLSAKSDLDRSNELGCDGARCPPPAAEARNSARAAGDLSTVFFISGGVLAAGGIALYVLGTGDGPQPGRPSARVAVSGSGLSLGGSF